MRDIFACHLSFSIQKSMAKLHYRFNTSIVLSNLVISENTNYCSDLRELGARVGYRFAPCSNTTINFAFAIVFSISTKKIPCN